MDIGDKIKQNRLQKDLTQDELAKVLNVSRSTVSSWEVGRNYPDLETLVAISDYFSLSLDKLIREDAEMVKSERKKLKYGKFFKWATLILSILLIAYIGMNFRAKYTNDKMKNTLIKNGWSQGAVDPINGGSNWSLYEGEYNYQIYFIPETTHQNIVEKKNKLTSVTSSGSGDGLVIIMSDGIRTNGYSLIIHTKDDTEFIIIVDENGNAIPEQIMDVVPLHYRSEIEEFIKQNKEKIQKVISKTIEKQNQVLDNL
ncbi:hypothetical protein BG261_04720 [Floricoccus tropicus]|uniref:HTH cro/C1-type domain-containing protein n=1 Tax=Floricoccus tropicus TaxID=1859473 RepID=A0A1E8GL63_9LACT|nr:helix-turn-helix transcriptional regulator [Floricoccus tropicus]OFI48969.1 hypothetical protein BG261_04720 [Floricoccus tropicus]